MEVDKDFNKAVDEQDVHFLARNFLKYKGEPIILTKTQAKIAKDIAFGKHNRIAINAMTRYGKTLTVATGMLLYNLLHDNKRSAIVAPLSGQTETLRTYLTEIIVESPILRQAINIDATGIERLKKEVSRNRITFKNGCEYRIFTAEGEANRLMSFGVDGLLIVDEAGLIKNEAWPKITRMLGDDPERTILIELANPWKRDTKYYDDYHNPAFKTYHIDYNIAIQEGRTTKEYIQEQKENLDPIDFQVLYESKFPTGSQNGFYSTIEIENLFLPPPSDINGDNYLGVDVARFGNDSTILTNLEHDEEKNITIVKDQIQEIKKDTVYIAESIVELDKKYNYKAIAVDDVGVGGGVVDQLRKLGLGSKLHPFSAGKSAKNKRRFYNLKTEQASNSKTLMRQNQLFAPNTKQLYRDVTSVERETHSDRTLKIVDPEKSPDYLDSMIIGLYAIERCINKPQVIAMPF